MSRRQHERNGDLPYHAGDSFSVSDVERPAVDDAARGHAGLAAPASAAGSAASVAPGTTLIHGRGPLSAS
jgi:hypothetical protein